MPRASVQQREAKEKGERSSRLRPGRVRRTNDSPPRVTGTARNLFRLVRLVSRSSPGGGKASSSVSRFPVSAKIIGLPAPRHRECPLCVRPDAGGMEGAWNLHRARERQGRPPAD